MEKREKHTVASLINRLFKWRKSIIIGTIIAFILACILVLVIPDYYKARTSFYPASQDLASPENIFGLTNNKTYYYGTTDDEDRIMAIASSKSLYNFLIDSFNLYKHYEIDSTDQDARYKIYNTLKGRYNVTKSENGEIHIVVVDRNPAFTARVANAATLKLQDLGVQDIKLSQKRMINNYESLISFKKKRLNLLQDSLAELKQKYKIIDSETQAEQLSFMLTAAQSKLIVYKSKMRAFKEHYTRDSIRKYAPIIEGLERKLTLMKADTSESAISISRFTQGSEAIYNVQQKIIGLSNSKNRMVQQLGYLRATYNSDIPSIHVLELADVPEVKYWPQRKLLVIGITALVFILLCFYALVREGYDSIDWNELTHGNS